MENARKRPFEVIFVCISNRVRSVFAEFLFKKMLAEKEQSLMNEVKVSSAGFIPQKMKDFFTEANILLPNPFYNRPMSEITWFALLEKGIEVSDQWRSKELTPEMVKESDLIVTALPHQKEGLIELFPEIGSRVFTLREISRWKDYLTLDDVGGVPLDHTFWHHVEENPEYVSKVLWEVEKILVHAFPSILEKLGFKA
ncbi:MAG: hypothetical protein ACPL6D_09140 [Thermodesulfobacteriota bacterium]